MKILKIEFENLAHFLDGKCSVDLMATDRVMDSSGLYQVAGGIKVHNTIVFVGLNATGKTTILRLLRAAMQSLLYKADLNPLFSANEMIQDGTILRMLFFHQGKYYLLESTIGIREEHGARYAYYKEELLYEKRKAKVRAKRDLFGFQADADPVKVRSALDDDVRSYLKDSTSIVVSVTKDADGCVLDYLDLNHVNLVSSIGSTPHEVLDIFDESIETFLVEPQGNIMHYKVRFKDSSKIYDTMDMLALNHIISAGTIKGQGLLQLAINTLKKGGYLLVDELEAHLNKELVHVIIDLFKSPKTNPYGACLLFSTHYAEILDFINRKDNIYITRKRKGSLSVSKYADEYSRNDVKKSEMILSNVLKGTAPSYEKIQRMRDVICASL